jgi:DNA repair exonuclease SbcCD ATPase subunit
MNLIKKIEELINEHGSSAILKERIAAIKEDVVRLEKENSNLKKDVEQLETERNELRKKKELYQEELLECRQFENKMEKCNLHEFPTKAIAYLVEQNDDTGEPRHYLCTTCVNNKKQTILQPEGRFLYCSVCDLSITTQYDTSLDDGAVNLTY